MAKTNIEWSDMVWNPLAGCTRVSPGCDNCYAAKMALRLEAMALADIEAGKDPGGKSKYVGIATKNRRGVPMFNGKINLDEKELSKPHSWKKPRRVFVNSMSDLFHHGVPSGFIDSVFDVMKNTPHHIYQVLTKRPERAADWAEGKELPLNIWIGTSVENQEQADKRIPELLKIPAAVRFLSMEPLLGAVEIEENLSYEWGENHGGMLGDFSETNIHWVIVGGESGPNARPMHPEWARSLRDQCQAAGVPYFFKQWGKYAPFEQRETEPYDFYDQMNGIWHDRHWVDILNPESFEINNGWLWDELDTVAFLKVGKKAAGRLLDGREWNEMPD